MAEFKELTDNQKRFCEEYIIDLNGTKAAIRAGYSEKTAEVQASRLLRNAKVLEFVSQLKEKRSERTEITADMVVKELAKIGFNNLQDYIDEGNTIKDLKTIPRDHAASVESIKIIETVWDGGTKTATTFKLHDKVSALEKLGRHLGIFEKDNEQNKPDLNVNFTETVISKKV